jgi:hypothetical protein
MKNSGYSSALAPLMIFIALVGICLAILSFYHSQVVQGYEYVISYIYGLFNIQTNPGVVAAVQPVLPSLQVTVPPIAPQDMTAAQKAIPQPSKTSIVEKVLPSSGNEVFNVAQNKFTYYDAEPLCKALGAELATYEQVKDAWTQGADWCNYGWVKGQMAVFPTQSSTFNRLQAGPVDQKNACGTVGINGGYFENPEFKYGVNCFGQKPNQTSHDQDLLMSEGKAPPTPKTFEVDAKIAEYKEEAPSLYVKPFSDVKWSDS